MVLLHWRECGIDRSFGLFCCPGRAAASERTRASSTIGASGETKFLAFKLALERHWRTEVGPAWNGGCMSHAELEVKLALEHRFGATVGEVGPAMALCEHFKFGQARQLRELWPEFCI